MSHTAADDAATAPTPLCQHAGHPEGEWLYSCCACSGMPGGCEHCATDWDGNLLHSAGAQTVAQSVADSDVAELYRRLRSELLEVADSLRDDRESLPAAHPGRLGLDVAETRLRRTLASFLDTDTTTATMSAVSRSAVVADTE